MTDDNSNHRQRCGGETEAQDSHYDCTPLQEIEKQCCDKQIPISDGEKIYCSSCRTDLGYILSSQKEIKQETKLCPHGLIAHYVGLNVCSGDGRISLVESAQDRFQKETRKCHCNKPENHHLYENGFCPVVEFGCKCGSCQRFVPNAVYLFSQKENEELRPMTDGEKELARGLDEAFKDFEQKENNWEEEFNNLYANKWQPGHKHNQNCEWECCLRKEIKYFITQAVKESYQEGWAKGATESYETGKEAYEIGRKSAIKEERQRITSRFEKLRSDWSKAGGKEIEAYQVLSDALSVVNEG